MGLVQGLRNFLVLPEIKDVKHLDAPSTTELHSRIIRQKKMLRQIYVEHYQLFKRSVPITEDGLYIEIGSGGGFIKEIFPEVTTSDVLPVSSVDQVFSACEMPFEDSSVDAVFMIDVLHHIKDSPAFFKEMERCLKPGGKVVMVEPANTWWGRFIYQNFHHEPFIPEQKEWEIEGDGALSDANGALPWIIFCRDKERFTQEFPELQINKVYFHTPLRYLLSGGVSMRPLWPFFLYYPLLALEWILTPLAPLLGMFMTIEIGKKST